MNVISTNGASEFWIRNENLIKIKDLDLNDFEVSLLINDTIVDTGNTKNVLDNPLNAVLWLINNLAEKGEPMLKGQFISSGSCTKAFRIYPKSKIKADFNSENLNISFNSKYLIDIASEIEDKNLKMNLKDSVSPVLIVDASDKNSYYVIMPMKI